MNANLIGILPELTLSATILAVVVLDLLARHATCRAKLLLATSVLGLVTAMVFVGLLRPDGVSLFSGMLALDGFGLFFKGLVYLVAICGVVLGLMSSEVRRAQCGEYLILLLCLTLGMSLLVSAQHLLMIYLAIELVSLPSYILAGFRHGDRRSSEAAIKYVLYGGAASGLMLYGFSLLYGLTGTLNLSGLGTMLVERTIAGSPAEQLILAIAVLLSLTGFGYKIAAVPFHMWCPDVYEGAPTPFVTFLSVGPKAAGFAALIRFLLVGFGEPAPLFSTDAFPWPLILGLVSMATMTVGNLAALPQKNVKRLLAYSSIAHAGYMLMAVAVGSAAAVEAVMLYLPIYFVMNIGAFMAVMAVREITGSEMIADYRGLGTRAPLLAVTLTIFLFSLIGIPPFAGFIGKFFLFAAVIQTGETFFYVVALVGVLNSVISLYYYARIIKACFLERVDENAGPVVLTPAAAMLLTLFAVPTLVIGVWWAPLLQLVNASATLLH